MEQASREQIVKMVKSVLNDIEVEFNDSCVGDAVFTVRIPKEVLDRWCLPGSCGALMLAIELIGENLFWMGYKAGPNCNWQEGYCEFFSVNDDFCG